MLDHGPKGAFFTPKFICFVRLVLEKFLYNHAIGHVAKMGFWAIIDIKCGHMDSYRFVYRRVSVEGVYLLIIGLGNHGRWVCDQ